MVRAPAHERRNRQFRACSDSAQVMPRRLETRAVVAGRPAREGAPLNEPLVPASTFLLGGDREYSRDDGTPTWQAFETVVGDLEDAEAIAFSSGMAGIAAVFELLPVGARIVWPDDCYQAVGGIIADGERLGRWTATRLAVDDTDAWCQAAGTADLVWVESPSNPLLSVADLQRISATPRAAGTLLAVDNTMAGPLGQQPLTLGVDIVVQSATKHLGGHSDLLCGVATTRRAELADALRNQRELRGATPGTLEAYLATRGIRTYPLRAAAAAASAQELARRLDADNRVEVVRYPGLTSHPTHHAATQICRASAASSRLMSSEALRRPTAYASECRSCVMPPVSVPSSPPSNEERPSPANTISRLDCSGSASASNTSRISGTTWIRHSERLPQTAHQFPDPCRCSCAVVVTVTCR